MLKVDWGIAGIFIVLFALTAVCYAVVGGF